MSYVNHSRFATDPIYREHIRAQRRKSQLKYKLKDETTMTQPSGCKIENYYLERIKSVEWTDHGDQGPLIRVDGMEFNLPEARIYIRQLLKNLTVRQHTILVDHVQHGAWTQLAEEFGITKQRVHQIFHKAMQKIRRELNEPQSNISVSSVSEPTKDHSWVEKHARRIEQLQRGPGYLVRRRLAIVRDSENPLVIRWMENHPHETPRHLR